MFFDNDEDLIEVGLLNKDGIKDKCLGYYREDYIHCGRYRVEIYESGMKVCEKCGVDQHTKDYVSDRYCNPFL